MMELESNDKLIQFLMGLNDLYDPIRNQIMVMDALPNLNKAYSMIVRVERQKEVHIAFTREVDIAMMIKSAMHVQKNSGKGHGNHKKTVNKDDLYSKLRKRKGL
ncbi:hypothetical protein Scep_017195 [Stephania cephalantha]|uniref:Uncharacterized protein n=1 Tax=Stephania cephalantha TaxID=152367 RepID=A0AAP0IQY9_9MAGN